MRVLARLFVVAIVAWQITCLTGCSRSIDAKLIGTWDLRMIDGTNQFTFQEDHTCVYHSDGIAGIVTGTGAWRLEGDRLITDYRGKESSGTIVRLTRHELQLRRDSDQETVTCRRVR